MNTYNKHIATVEELQKLSSSIQIFHYNRENKIVIPEHYTDVDQNSLFTDIEYSANVLKFILSKVSKKIYKFQQNDDSQKYFMKNGWKTPILINVPTMAFILPEQFTQEFIDSKEGKRFKDKKPCAHMFMRALQSQKTIMEQLQIKEV